MYLPTNGKIVEIKAGGPAAIDGRIFPGDILLAVNQRIITKADDIASILLNASSTSILTFKRSGNLWYTS